MAKPIKQPTARLVGKGYDPATRSRYWIIEGTGERGKSFRLVFPFGSRQSLEGPILEAIGRAGFPVPLLTAERKALFEKIVQTEPKLSYQVASTSGWATRRTFVTPRKVYGGRQVVSALGQSPFGDQFRRAGKHVEWRRTVAAPLLGNDVAMFGVASAFATPLQELTNVESGGFHLVGPSSIGKSTILTLAGSVWGGGGPLGFCNSWLTTANALDDIAAAHSGCFLALDEASLAGDTLPAAAHKVLHAAYRLAGGQEKARKGDVGRRQAWRIQFLGSTEHSLEMLANNAREHVAAGQFVRIIDIRADAGCGLGVWEKIPKSSSAAQFSDTLRNAAMRVYGSAGDRYLTCLVAEIQKDRDGLIAWLEKRMRAFLKTIHGDQWSAERARLARRFALVYAAGALAGRYGILPWKREAILSAVKACHGRVMWPKALLDPQTPERSIAAVREYIARHHGDLIDLCQKGQKITKEQANGAPGLIFAGKHSRREYLFSQAVFRDQVCAGIDSEQAWLDLHRAGLLHLQEGGKRTVTRDLPKPGGRLRVISIRAAILDQGTAKAS